MRFGCSIFPTVCNDYKNYDSYQPINTKNSAFQAKEKRFYDAVADAVDVRGIPLDRVINFDQTSVRHVNPEQTTLERTGAKEVIVTHLAVENECFTVSLEIQADGQKIPAVIVFKRYCKDGTLSQRTTDALEIPENVIIKSSGKAWWKETLDMEWINPIFEVSIQKSMLFSPRCLKVRFLHPFF